MSRAAPGPRRGRARPPPMRVEITSLAPGGEGVGHVEWGGRRRAVFVRASAPGDVVEAEFEADETPLRASRVLRLLAEGPGRRAPACAHAERCGGCAWGHLTPERRAAARVELVSATVLRALGSPPGLEVVDHPAPSEERYRTRARLAARGGARPLVGYRPFRGGGVVDVGSCLVLDRRLEPVVGLLREALGGSRGEGEARAALGAGGAPTFELAWSGELAPRFFERIERLVGEGRLAGAALRLEGARAPVVVGDPRVLTEGPDGLPLEVPSGGFAQANPAVTGLLAGHLRAALEPAGKRLVELYAGAGTLSVALAPGAADYVAVESDAAALEAARRNFAARALKVRTRVADAASYPLDARPDGVVLDPPRAGAAALVPRLVGARPREVMYVSCDPVTLARDAAALAGAGYTAESLHTFDMFPQTDHVEAALHLVRRAGARR
ncbi:MAG TPA: methyltransferase [Polyangiaceae bacterium]|nr:methyltransferase [Polyangiaceae bacterium]